jgi:GMP synthase (glutamine-hydrolysing)
VTQKHLIYKQYPTLSTTMQRRDRPVPRKAGRRIAIVSCEPEDQEPMTFKGAKRTLRRLVQMRFDDLGFESAIHRPIRNKTDFPNPGRYGAVVIGGSKLDIFDEDLKRYEWMRYLLDFVRETHAKVPILGICFGHQAVGRAFGAELKRYGPAVGYEVGYSEVRLTPEANSDTLFNSLPGVFNALFSHFSYIANTPDGGTALVFSQNPENQSVQAFRMGESTWAVQFHPEYPPEAVRDLVFARREKIGAIVDVSQILADLDSQQRHDHLVLKNFAELL